MNKLDTILLKHQIYPDYAGYEYISYIMQQSVTIGQINITTEYKFMANTFDTTPSAIERNIRFAISKSDLKGLSNKRALALLQLEYKGRD